MSRLFVFALIAPMLALYHSASLVEAQRFAPGYCPTVTAQENFDKTRFFGNWIEVEKTPSIFDLMMRCLVVDYSDDQDNTVNVVVRGISLAGLPLTVNGDGLLQDVHRSGFYSIRYGFGVPFQGTLTTILDTDYEDYAVVYSCTNSLLSGVFHSEYIWVLSRSGKISNPTRQNIYEKLDKLNINRSGLTMSDRSTCPSNSSLIARESDKDLAGQQPINVSGATAASSGPDASNSASNGNGNSAESAPIEPTQKSVVVPLLYDTPSTQKVAAIQKVPSGDKAAQAAKQAADKQQAASPTKPASSASSSTQSSQSSAPSSPSNAQSNQQPAQSQPASPNQTSSASPPAGSAKPSSSQQQASSAPQISGKLQQKP